jgi:thiamine kinase-like enzyme
MLMPKYFTPIHGDPTFSNSLIDKNLRAWFIDPRGYFSKTGIWGDPMYDFAKVYYSAIGGYDIFNRRKFKLHVDNETVEIIMEESAFSNAGEEIFHEFFGKDVAKIKVLHGLIWLALSGYAKDDIDSVIGSFYLGLYYLEQGLELYLLILAITCRTLGL